LQTSDEIEPLDLQIFANYWFHALDDDRSAQITKGKLLTEVAPLDLVLMEKA